MKEKKGNTRSTKPSAPVKTVRIDGKDPKKTTSAGSMKTISTLLASTSDEDQDFFEPLNLDAAADLVNLPPHYRSHPSGIECIEITQHMNFCLGNAMKYIWRCEDKGDKIENLEKAIWYLRQEIEREQSQREEW